jgi:hypothetical protein
MIYTKHNISKEGNKILSFFSSYIIDMNNKKKGGGNPWINY